jgi:uncharacterized membrane protein (DUF485 family)
VTDRAAEAAFVALDRARTRIAAALTVAVVVVYFGFVFAVAFARPVLAWVIVPGLTLVYVRWANRHYDHALRALRDAS